MTTTRTSLAVVAVTAALGLGACGGSSTDNSPKGKYIAKADVICKQIYTRLAKLAQPTDLAGIARIAQQGATYSNRAIVRFKALHPPAAIQSGVNDFIKALELQTAKIAALVPAAKKGDQAAIRAISTEGITAQKQAKDAAKRVGYKVCGSQG